MLFTTVDISGKVVLRQSSAVCLKTTLPDFGKNSYENKKIATTI